MNDGEQERVSRFEAEVTDMYTTSDLTYVKATGGMAGAGQDVSMGPVRLLRMHARDVSHAENRLRRLQMAVEIEPCVH
jgi:hypothetical protein